MGNITLKLGEESIYYGTVGFVAMKNHFPLKSSQIFNTCSQMFNFFFAWQIMFAKFTQLDPANRKKWLR